MSDDGGAARVELVAEAANIGSIRVAEAAGFIRERVLRQRVLLRDRRADVVMYAMLATDTLLPNAPIAMKTDIPARGYALCLVLGRPPP